ncbi:MAG: protein-L-isoaspartate(D-aspartate) O-methyltransferase [Chloroflexota bacterium]|nr:protein-L-isoaspartate(D-aspartate) O-methyltransferase [Chloroflexota bacterium]
MNQQSDSLASRERMIAEQLRPRGIRNEEVLRAILAVPREAFVPDHEQVRAYADEALPIGLDQTISQPFIVALMAEALLLEGTSRVLEVGTGSGYAAAVLSLLADEVYTMERHPALARQAASKLYALGFLNVHVVVGDGTRGLQQQSPYTGISVPASGPTVPNSLKEQLAISGRLVMPVGLRDSAQKLLRVTRTGPFDYEEEDLGGVGFVPLIGAEGWEP